MQASWLLFYGLLLPAIAVKTPQENIEALPILKRNVATFTQGPTSCSRIRADICCPGGAICSKNNQTVSYHRGPQIPRQRCSSLIMAPATTKVSFL